MDLHESAVTAAIYVPDCPSDVIPALYSIGAKQMQQRRATYSAKVRHHIYFLTLLYQMMLNTGH
jgi:hypothetical protein